MNELTFILILSFVAIAIAFAVLFSIVSDLKRELRYHGQKIDNRAFESSIRILEKTSNDTRDKVDALVEYLNVDLTQEPQKYVLKDRS